MGFAADIGKFSEKARGRVDHVVVNAAEEMVREIIDNTPKVTGWTRGNWQTSVNASKTGVLPLRPEMAALVEVSAACAFARGVDAKVFVRNNCPHINRLEYDAWSKQAPGGMVRKAIAKWGRIVHASVLRAKGAR
jgi:hypothetical protein